MSLPVPDPSPGSLPTRRERLRRAWSTIWARITAPTEGTEVGWFRLDVWAIAAALTVAFYLAWNLVCLGRIDAAYDDAVLPDLAGVETTHQAVKTVRDVAGADPKLRDDGLPEAFAPAQPPKPLHTQLEVYVEAVVAGSPDPGAAERRARFLRDRLTGNRTGAAFLLVGTEPASGVQIVKDLKRTDRDWAKKVEARPDAREYEAFVARLADLLSAQVRPKIRPLERMNGWVQWLTVFLAWFVVVLCGKRFYWLATPEGRHRSRMGGSAYREEVEVKVYGSLSYLLAALPSLGFIGTVVGMGEALLLADGLFTEANKQQAIGRITRQLGFAFDTTLVALVAGLLVGVVAVALRSFEVSRMASPPSPPPHRPAPSTSRETADGFGKV